jgi:hypothetical protein
MFLKLLYMRLDSRHFERKLYSKKYRGIDILAESFYYIRHLWIVNYYVKYGSSIITSKIPSKILSNKNKKTGVSRKIVCFGILIHI